MGRHIGRPRQISILNLHLTLEFELVMNNFETRLTGGHPNSLGNTVGIVEEVLTAPDKFEELFNCYFSEDEVVRLRVSNAMKRICKANKPLLIPYVDRLLNEISKINQASTQWTLASLFMMLEKEMTAGQVQTARKLMKNNLANHQDWIVLNTTMETLGKWAKKDAALREWITPHVQRLANDSRKSVAGKAKKIGKALGII